MSHSDQILQMMIDHSPTAFAVFDKQMCYLLASRRWKEDYDLEGQDLVGQSHYDIFPDIPERWRHAHRLGLDGKRLRKEGDCFVRKNGQVYWQSWEILPWYINDGKVGGIVIFSEDLTFYKKVEEEVRNLNASLEKALKVSNHELMGWLMNNKHLND